MKLIFSQPIILGTVFIVGLLVVIAIYRPLFYEGDIFRVYWPIYAYLLTWGIILVIQWLCFNRYLRKNTVACLILLGIFIALGALVWTLAIASRDKMVGDAAQHNHLFILKILLLRTTQSEKDYALVSSCVEGNLEIVQYLLATGANPNARLFGNQTALILAVQSGSVETVKTLIIHGADPNAPDKDGLTPFVWAKRKEKPEVLKVLIGSTNNAY